jgi:hypothetical protein
MSDFNINDPLSFFELEKDFTAKELKRAYTKKIKQYKPEKFPEEFKQIRAAYEELESQSAYSRQSETTPPAVAIDSDEVTGTVEQDITFIPQAPSLEERYSGFSEEGQKERYEELKIKDDKSPQESLLCLLLKEQLEGKSALIEALPQFLEQFHQDKSAEQFVAYLLKEDLPAEEAILLLPLLAKNLNGFYYNAETLLQKILREKGVDDFFKVLKSCEDKISFAEKNDAGIFYSRIISRYFFRFPKEWILEQVQRLNEDLQLSHDYLDEKLDFIDHLIEFAESLTHYLPDEKLIQDDLVDCIQTYCECPGLEAEIHFYTLMKKLRSEDYLLKNIQYQSAHISPAFKVLNTISEEYKFTRRLEDDTDDSILSIHKFLQKINGGKNNSMPRIMSFISLFEKATKVILYCSLALIICTPFFIIKSYLLTESNSDLAVIVTLIGVIISTFAALFPYRKTWPKCDEQFSDWAIAVSHKQYYKYLRKPLLDFMMNNMVTEAEINKGLNMYSNTNIQCSYIQIGIPEDYAISLASIAAVHRA